MKQKRKEEKKRKNSNDGILALLGIIEEQLEILLSDKSISVGIGMKKSVASSVGREKGADISEGFGEFGGAEAAVLVAVVVSEDYK